MVNVTELTVIKCACGQYDLHAVPRHNGLPCNTYNCGCCCPYKNQSPCPKEKKFGGVAENLFALQNPK